MGAMGRREFALPTAAAIVLAATALVALMLHLTPRGDAGAALEDGLLVLAALGAMAAFLLKASRDADHGRIWRTLAVAAALFFVAEAYWFAVEVVLGEAIPAVSLADAFYFGGYAVLAVALIRSFPGRPDRRTQVRLVLDGVIVLTSLAGVLWLLFIRDLAHSVQPALNSVVVTAYPALDLTLLAGVLFRLRDIRGLHRPHYLLLALGLSLWAVVDLVYAMRVLQATFASGLPTGALWVGGYASFAAASYVRPGAKSKRGQPLNSVWANLVYAPVAAAAPVAVWEFANDRTLDLVLFTLGIVLILAMAGRQIVVTRELAAANRKMQQEATALEEAQSIGQIGSWDYDFRSDTVVLSREARRICGFDPDIAEVQRDQFVAMVPLQDRPTIDLERFEKEHLATFEMEHRIRRPDGETRHLVHRGRTEYRKGRPVRASGTMQDVTERTQVLERLRFQSTLLESVGESIVAADAEGRITYWSDAATALYGWRQEEVRGKPALDILAGPDDQEGAQEILATLQRGESWEGEFPLRRKDGSTIIAHLRNDPVLDEAGDVVGVIGVSRDVTRRSEMETELRMQAHLLDSVGEAVIATDLDGAITYWNRAAERIYGWAQDEVMGRPIVEVTPSKATRKQAEQIMESMSKGEPWSGEFEVQRKDGSSFLADVHNTPVTDDQGGLVGIIGVSHDISERKKLEIDLRERLKELRALYAVAAAAATTEEVTPLLRSCVDALGPAFLHDDTWIFVEIGAHSASSAEEKPDGTPLVKDFQTTLGKGWIEVRYRSEHEAQHAGPFIKEEVDLLDAVAEMLVSCTARVHAVDELASREAALSQAQRMTKIGSWKWDPKEDVATWSDEVFEIFERAREDGPARIEEALGFFTEDSRAALRPELERVADQGGSYMLELEVILASGRTKTVISRGEAVTDRDGRVDEIRGTVQDITEWTQAQADLRFQADLLNEVRHAVIATDLEGTISYWNPAASTVFGWEADEVVGKAVSDVLGEQHTNELEEESTADQWMERKDGTSLLVNLSSSPLADADGRLVGFIGVAQDVTKDRAIQRQYQELVEHSPNGILRTTPEGSLEYANPAAAALLGYESADQLKTEITDMQDLYIEPDERTRFLEHLKDNEAEPFQTRLRRRDGAPLWVEIRARLHRRPDGTTSVEGTFHDLTAERMQTELSRRLAAIVESADEAIYSKTLDGVIETWNNGAERTFGYTAEEAIGKSFNELVVPDELQDEYWDMMRRLREGHVVPRFETVRQRKDGSRIDYSLALTPIRDASGRIIAASVSGHDISDRKRAEEAERAQIENEHLKEVDQTLRDFINAAAHDLNQPLTPMRLSLSLLEKHTADLPETAQRTVAMLSRSVDRMALLLQDMLDVSRLESGTLSFDIKDVPLPALLQETGEFFQVQAEEKDIDLVIDNGFDGDVAADDRRVIQVLFNYVGNAMKFTPEGGRITISSKETDGMARVAVKDTGPGLTEEQMGKLFKAFSQVHGAGGPKGTGLGLYISRGIIAEHGGEAGVESDGPDQGSTFWFTVPVASGTARPTEAGTVPTQQHG